MGSHGKSKNHYGKHHGMYGTPTYKSWANMKDRCGKKGYEENITYCKEWENFRNFFKDMGIRPEGTSLDRIDPHGNYCKENCRWADYETQENNRTNNRKYLYKGEWLTLPRIARKYNVKYSNLSRRIYHYKMDIDDAVDYVKNKLIPRGARNCQRNECLVRR